MEPPADLPARALMTTAIPSGKVRTIHSNSYKMSTPKWDGRDNWETLLQTELRKLIESSPKGRLSGVILCGPLAPKDAPDWLMRLSATLEHRGLDISGDFSEAELGGIWISPKGSDAVAEGAKIYGERVLSGMPTYFDTLPPLSILTLTDGKFKWSPLVEESKKVVMGGMSIKEVFEINLRSVGGSKDLMFICLKGTTKKGCLT